MSTKQTPTLCIQKPTRIHRAVRRKSPSLGIGIVGQALDNVFALRHAYNRNTGDLPDSSLEVAIVGSD